MCYFDQIQWSCGFWRWGPFRERCTKEYRTGETCGLRFLYETQYESEICKLCRDIEKKHEKYNRFEADILRWQREGNRHATIEKLQRDMAETANTIYSMQQQHWTRLNSSGKRYALPVTVEESVAAVIDIVEPTAISTPRAHQQVPNQAVSQPDAKENTTGAPHSHPSLIPAAIVPQFVQPLSSSQRELIGPASCPDDDPQQGPSPEQCFCTTFVGCFLNDLFIMFEVAELGKEMSASLLTIFPGLIKTFTLLLLQNATVQVSHESIFHIQQHPKSVLTHQMIMSQWYHIKY